MTLRIPPAVNIAVLVLGATALYTYIGQLVPQKEVLPPQETQIADDVSTEELVDIGSEIAGGKGLCFTCHTVGESGALRFPDLEGIGQRAGTRIEGLGQLEYLAHSIYHPDEFIVEGFSPGMPAIDKPPIALSDKEILAVLAYLQSLGGTPTVTADMTRVDLGVE